MTLALPWHSNPSWQPTEVTQFINHVNSGAGTLIVRTDAGLLALLVSKVEFDQSDCTIAITFHASGIESLEQQTEQV